VCTLSSLTPDGGNIAMMKLRIEKVLRSFSNGERLLKVIQVYPVAYLEFIQGEDGKRRRIGPMGEKEEIGARDAWQVGASDFTP